MSAPVPGNHSRLGWFQRFRIWLAARLLNRKPHPPPTAKMLTGAKGEALAAKYLRKLGWKIITRNWRDGRDKRDELDIVAHDGETLVFVEVKTRTLRVGVAGDGTSASPFTANCGAYEAVNTRKRRALARAAHAYLRALSRPITQHRFDIIEVLFAPDSALPPEIRHHRAIPLFSQR